MDKNVVLLMLFIVGANQVWVTQNKWLTLLFIVLVVFYISYLLGYRSGKNRALSDNVKDTTGENNQRS